MNQFLKAIITKTRIVFLILLAVVFAGTFAWINIPKEDTPDVQIPTVVVRMSYEGISPRDSVRLLIKPIETALSSVEGLKNVKSTAFDSGGIIILEFQSGYNIEKAISDVRIKIDENKSKLPANMKHDPTVDEINLSQFPILSILITGNVPERFLIKTARDLQSKIEGISNILEANIIGDREDIIEIEVDPAIISSYSLSLNDIYKKIAENNQLVAAGFIDTETGQYSVKVPGLLENVEEIMNLPIKVDKTSSVKISDIAKVKKTYKDRTNYARVEGKPAIVIEVVKRSGANIIETIEEVKELVKIEQQELPETIDISYSNDSSKIISNVLTSLQNNILLALILVLIIVVAAIGITSGVFVAIALPITFLMGILFLYLFGYTLNMIVLFSLILSIGLLVDNSIIIMEYAELKMDEGLKYKDAFLISVKYMSKAIISSTATTLIVFAPLLFWPGVVGQFMKYLPITLIIVLGSSLITALIFLPAIAIMFGKKLFKKRRKELKKTKSPEELPYSEFVKEQSVNVQKFIALLEKVLNKPKKFTLSIFGILLLTYVLYSFFGKGIEFFPSIEPEHSVVIIRARGNLSLQEKDAISKLVEERILDMKNDIKIFYTKSGNVARINGNEDIIAYIQLEYQDWHDRRKSNEILADIRKRTQDLYGIIIETSEESSGPSNGAPINIEVGSYSLDKIDPAVEQVLQAANKVGGLINIHDNRSIPSIEWKININRNEALKLGVDVGLLGNFIKLITNGVIVASYRPEDVKEEVDIVIRFPKHKRNLDELSRLTITTDDGDIPISNFIQRKAEPKVSKIHRKNGIETITISANVQPGVLPDNKVKEIQKELKKYNLGKQGISVKFTGENERKQETMRFLIKALIAALFGMVLILLIQFNSYYHVFVIMSSVFLSTTGVLLGLLITGRPFGLVMCGVGIIALSGVVVNDSIILIDTYYRFKEKGMEIKEAIIKATVQRLSPIILTSATTVLGLFPMILGMNINFITREVTFGSPSSQWWTQLSTTIAGGVAFATVLTLVFTPALLMVGEKKKSKNKD